MLFRITSTDNKVFYYDNLLTRFFDQFHNKITFDYVPQLNQVDDYPYNKETWIKEDNHLLGDGRYINRLEIYVGYKCNYRCKYCIQKDHSEWDNSYDFDLFKQRFEKSGLLPNLTSVKLSGGEPLVYLDRVEKFVKYFREDLQYRNHLQIATNGSLFTNEVCDFCEKYDVDVIFTHDAQTQTYYRNPKDYLDDPEIKSAVIRQLKRKQTRYGASDSGFIMCVLNPMMIDAIAAYDYLNEKLYDGVPVITYLISKYDRDTVHLMTYTKQSYHQLYKNLKSYYKFNDPNNKYYINFWRMLKVKERVKARIVNEVAAGSLLSRCPYQIASNRLAVTGNGDCLFCYACRPEDKHAQGNMGDLNNVKFHITSLNDTKEICTKCPYLITCGNPCPILSDMEDIKIRCKSLTPLHRAMFEAAVEELLNIEIKEIVPCDQSELFI